MELQQKLNAVLDLAARLDVRVMRAPLDGNGGGLCHLRGERILFVDTSADLATQCERSLSALAQLPDFDTVFLLPQLREEAERLRGREE